MQEIPAHPAASGHERLADEFCALIDQARSMRVRALLVLSGEQDWTLATARSLLAAHPARAWFAGSRDRGLGEFVAFDHAGRCLGRECELLLFNAFDGLHPNALGALAGTIVGGGALVLLAPPLACWADYDDPDYRRLSVFGATGTGRRFLLRFAQVIAASDGWLVEQGRPSPPLPELPGPALPERLEFVLTAEQELALADIQRVAHGHRRRPLVLTADRGRGKSTALGVAAARLLAAGTRHILVTAPAAGAVESLFAHCQRHYPGGERRGDSVHWRQGALTYLPPDEMRRNLPDGELLLVDEAAGIPAPLLADLLAHYPRVVFATTVHGYEGHGRGFALRFLDHLRRHTPGFHQRQLREPVRWSSADTLEPLVFRALLLDAEVPEPAAQDGQVQPITQDELMRRPALLQHVHGLLVQAHYRTTPDDLRVLLDGPNIRLFVAHCGDTVAGAVLVAVEGQLPGELEPAIGRGERRLAGHVLPQVLVAQAGMRAVLPLACWRVVRVAVHPHCRRQGLGAALLAAVEQAAQDGADYIGSSFAATADVAAFWARAGYRPLHLGWRRDSTTGSHALVVGKPLSAAGASALAGQLSRWQQEFPQLLADHLSALEPELVVALLADAAAGALLPDARDIALLREFAGGHRQYETCSLAVRKLALRWLVSAGCTLAPTDCRLLVRRCLQLQSWARVAADCTFTGKPEAVSRLRRLCGLWLAQDEAGTATEPPTVV